MSECFGDDFLHRQLIRLGDMMGDGVHLEPGGKWISVEYRRVCKALGILKKRKMPTAQIDSAMEKRLADIVCPSCGGRLLQSRRGSFRAVCQACGGKFQVLRRKV